MPNYMGALVKVEDMKERAALTPEMIVEAAVAFVDKNGIDALTLRSLGKEIGAHHTALYRHFRSKEDLASAMFDYVVGEIGTKIATGPTDPLVRIRNVAITTRTALHKHPALVGIIVMSRDSAASISLQELVKLVISDLRELGVPEKELAIRYQVIETYVFGSALFDYSGAPNHLAERKKRLGASELKVFKSASGSEKGIDLHNEAAFTAGLDLILTGLKSKK
ncbi:MAG: TetR/AcrR family transcriptional regulator [Candidatus Nanopelagicales bacterium]|nr:TetR/AcrR family transcriptional regulator [Candidatus Nanopelagicales bacterium]